MHEQLKPEDFVGIEMVLASYSDGAHIDRIEYQFSKDSMEAVAVFYCDHFGTCVVSKVVANGAEITDTDLATMAGLANAQLERVVCDSGWGAVFDTTRIGTEIVVPIGFKVEYRELH